MGTSFYDAIEARRSNYGLSGDSPIGDGRIREVVEFCTLHTPSAFNAQNGRVCVLFGAHHDRLWDIVLDALRDVAPEDQFDKTREKIASFKAGHGTVLFFEDTGVTESLQRQFPLYRDHFPTWSTQAGGMLQFAVWTALTSEGLGASLQHYNPLIDDAVRQAFGIDAAWKLAAQMPFGAPTGPAGPKTFADIAGRVKVFG